MPLPKRERHCYVLRDRDLHPGLEVLLHLFFQKGMDYTIFLK